MAGTLQVGGLVSGLDTSKIIEQLMNHPLTDKGITTFRDDWDKARQAKAGLS